MWNGFVGLIAQALSAFHDVLGNWGLAIILFTAAIKIITWPLTGKQIASARGMQELQPKMKALQDKYKDDKEAQTREVMKLYQESGVNPMMGCFPMLIQFPVWIGLYQAIIELANNNRLGEGFLFLPTLACPTTSATAEECVRMGLTGMAWVLNVANLANTWPYLILPILTIVTQVLISRIMTPATASASNSDDPTAAITRQMTTIMPLMFGVFALQFPAGLALYWVTNNVLTGLQYAISNRGSLAAAVPLSAATPEVAVEGPRERPVYPKESSDVKPRRKRKKR